MVVLISPVAAQIGVVSSPIDRVMLVGVAALFGTVFPEISSKVYHATVPTLLGYFSPTELKSSNISSEVNALFSMRTSSIRPLNGSKLLDLPSIREYPAVDGREVNEVVTCLILIPFA